MAEAMLKEKLKGLDLDIRVMSAGTAVFREDTASRHAIKVMGERGIDLSGHRSKPVNERVLEQADLILTMTQNHKRTVLDIAPHLKGKVFTLKEYVLEKENAYDVEIRLSETMQRLNEKRNAFLEKHKPELMELRRKKEELVGELRQVEKELKEWDKRLEKEIEAEKNEIQKLQGQLADLDISDPFGGPIEYYRESAREIEEAIDRLIEKLKDN
jgi:protein-tyrosine phosphatase